MFIIKDNTTMMAISKGDSGYFTITFEGDIPDDGTDVIFTIKQKLDGPSQLIKHIGVADGAVLVGLTSQDTNKLEPGKYYWDIRVIFSDVDVVTPMKPGLLQVLEVAGDV